VISQPSQNIESHHVGPLAPELALVDAFDGVGADRPQVIRVAIADGNALVGAGFHALLDNEEGIAVVGSAGDGEAALQLARRTHPTVLVIDANIPGIEAVEVTRQIAADPELSPVNVLMLATGDRDDRVFEALRAGVSGLLLRNTRPAELFEAVRAVAAGDAVLAPRIARRLIVELASRPEPHLPDLGLLGELTPREREVVALVGLGLSNDEIADRLVITHATAKTHVSRAMVKLSARDRAQLVVFAYESGLALPRADAPPVSDAEPLSLVS